MDINKDFFEDGLFDIKLSHANLGGHVVNVVVSELMSDETAAVFRLNENTFTIVASRKLSPTEFLNVISLYWEREWIRKLKEEKQNGH